MYPSVGGYQPLAPAVLPLEELLVLNLLGEEVEKAMVSFAPTRSNVSDELRLFCWGIVRSGRSTREEEEVQAWDRRPPPDQKVPAEHRPSHPKAPVFATRTCFPTRNNRILKICTITYGRFVGSRSRTGHDGTNERICGSRYAMAEFCRSRSSRSSRSLSRSST